MYQGAFAVRRGASSSAVIRGLAARVRPAPLAAAAGGALELPTRKKQQSGKSSRRRKVQQEGR